MKAEANYFEKVAIWLLTIIESSGCPLESDRFIIDRGG